MQFTVILALIFALVIGLLSVANIAPVSVNYILGSVELPLITVIIGATLTGGLIVGLLSFFRQTQMQWKIYTLQKNITRLENELKIASEKAVAEKKIHK